MAREPEQLELRLSHIEDELRKLRRGMLANVELTGRQNKAIGRDIREVVPVICFDEDVQADVYWCHIGAGLHPDWVGSLIAATTGNWDATDTRFYASFNNINNYLFGGVRNCYPTGPFGAAHTFEQKAIDADKCILEFRARFNTNADYTVYGVGLVSDNTAASHPMGVATNHFIQVTRNSGSWELGSCDGATISQSSGGTANGSLHDFRVEWKLTTITLFVDEVAVVTKTTNLPAQPLILAADINSAANTMELMGVRIRWQ